METEEMRARRFKALDALLELPATYIKRYTSRDAELLCKRRDGSGCSTLMLGALDKCLLVLEELLEEPETLREHRSIRYVVNVFYDMPRRLPQLVGAPQFIPSFQTKNVLEKVSSVCTSWHDECNFLLTMLADVNKIVESIEGLELEEWQKKIVA
jgi:hypothetical protein